MSTSTQTFFVPKRTRVSQLIAASVSVAAFLVMIALAWYLISATGLGAAVVFIPALVVMAGFVVGMIRTAQVHQGPILELTPRELRQRDLFGWMIVPWSQISEVHERAGGKVIVITAPQAIRLNERAPKRSQLQLQPGRLDAPAGAVLAEIQRRVRRAGGTRQR